MRYKYLTHNKNIEKKYLSDSPPANTNKTGENLAVNNI